MAVGIIPAERTWLMRVLLTEQSNLKQTRTFLDSWRFPSAREATAEIVSKIEAFFQRDKKGPLPYENVKTFRDYLVWLYDLKRDDDRELDHHFEQLPKLWKQRKELAADVEKLSRDERRVFEARYPVSRMGSATNPIDGFGSEIRIQSRVVRSFLRDVRGKRFADIGCATGYNTLSAFEAGAKSGICIERDPQALNQLVQHAYVSERRGYNPLKKLDLGLGMFPKEISLKSNSYDRILISHVFHYMKGREMRQVLKEAYDALVPGGKLYIQTLTIWADPYDRVRKTVLAERKPEHVWPYYCSDIQCYGMQKEANPLDIDILTREVGAVFEEIEHSGCFKVMDSGDWSALRGADCEEEKEMPVVGMIAVKRPS